MKDTGTLYLIPTVISENSGFTVLPAQVKDHVDKIDHFMVENVRTTRRYFSKLGIAKPITELHFEVLDKKTDPAQLEFLFGPLYEGKDMGVVSESGCPGIADPGALAVAYAHEKGIRVVPLVGPSSILLALMASGFSGQNFTFLGYLPIAKKEAAIAIKQIERDSKKRGQTQIFIEAPYRNNQLKDLLLDTCQGATRLCIAKGISGQEEFIRTACIRDWKKLEIDLHKVPTVFLLYA